MRLIDGNATLDWTMEFGQRKMDKLTSSSADS